MSDARREILDSVHTILRREGAHRVTFDGVAKTAGCAKGLVTYHFGRKGALLAEAAREMATQREQSWTEALTTDAPTVAIDRTWKALVDDAASGRLRAWNSLATLGDPEVDQAVRDADERFRVTVAQATAGLLDRIGAKPGIPAAHMAWLFAAVFEGVGIHAARGADLADLENAYAAVWLGMLALGGGDQ